MGAAFKYADALKNEESTAAFIPYSSHVTKNVVKLANGDYIATIRMQGAAHESADVQDINSWHDQLNGFMRNIASPNTAVWSHVVRREYGEYPEKDREESGGAAVYFYRGRRRIPDRGAGLGQDGVLQRKVNKLW